jgi:hypothetical protein
MTLLSGFNIVIIDFPEACELRASLMRAGATVHVVSRGGALILARNRRIDAAFVGFGVDAVSRRLCEELTCMGVGQIILTAGDTTAKRAQKEREMIPEIVFGVSRANRIRCLTPSSLCN